LRCTGEEHCSNSERYLLTNTPEYGLSAEAASPQSFQIRDVPRRQDVTFQFQALCKEGSDKSPFVFPDSLQKSDMIFSGCFHFDLPKADASQG